MNFSCEQQVFNKAVQTVEKIIATKSSLPIIGNIFIKAEEGKLKFYSNDMELGVEVTIPAKIISPGNILAPAKILGNIANKLPNTTVEFNVLEKNYIEINCGTAKFNLHGLLSDEFPLPTQVKDTEFIILSTLNFSNLVKQTIFAASTDEGKHILNGLLFEIIPEKGKKDSVIFKMVATDGYRLSQKISTAKTNITKPTSFIVPSRALNEILHILPQDEKQDVKINISPELISFSFGDIYFVSRLIQGQFPDYNQVIPKSFETEIITKRKSFLEAAERSSIIASSSANVIKLKTATNKLKMSANTPDLGAVYEEIDVKTTGSSKSTAAFNVRLLTDVLKNLNQEDIFFGLSGGLSPGIIKAVGSEDYLYVIMPIRTQEEAN
jgi:DNA polymerase-3 subunit beta